VVVSAVVVSAVVALTGCSHITRRAAGYHVTAYFQEAVSLYPRAPVTIMGARAGTVDGVHIDGARVRVTMTIKPGVPISPDVKATIGGLSLVGERSVILSPPWHPGQSRINNGFVIPLDNTTTPVEPDEGLKSFINLINAIEPNVVSELITTSARTFKGNEQTFHDLINTTANIWNSLGRQDQRIVDAANNVHDLLTLVNQQPLGDVINEFSQATSVLAGQRQALGAALDASLHLVNAGSSLLDTYGATLPGDLATLTKVEKTIEANLPSFNDFFKQVAAITAGIDKAYNPATGSFNLGVDIQPSLAGPLNLTFDRIVCRLGLARVLPPSVSC
jgi:phospholipid/cholesterol/gamma-HCH transport system substrate-binding protein